MSLTVLNWLGLAGIVVVTVQYCGVKLFPKSRPHFQMAAYVSLAAVNIALIWLCLLVVNRYYPFLDRLGYG